MNQQEYEKLMELLGDLMEAQDELSRTQCESIERTAELIAKRRDARNAILDYVNSITE